MTDTARPRIFIVEDHQVVRKGLAQMLSEFDYDVCGEAGDLEDGMAGIKNRMPDAVILDLSLGNQDGIDMIQGIRELKIPVLVFSMHEDPIRVQRALQAGALGYVTKQEVMDILIDAIEEILSGNSFVSPRITAIMVDTWSQKTAGPDNQLFEPLSKREMEVYRLVGKGYATSEIAVRLCLSPKTIESYIARLKVKLDLATNRELLRHAINHAEQSEG